jgi:hypothetical protein
VRQGHKCPEQRVLKIVELLRATDMTMARIAERMGCSSTLVLEINRRYSIRHYRGRRTTWASGDPGADSDSSGDR